MGGALSMLWHTQAGPVFAATMNQYKLIEAPNMQSNSRKYLTGGTPRIELMQDGVAYSNLDDLNTDIDCHAEKGSCTFTVHTHLVDINQQAPPQGEVAMTMNYTYSEQGISIHVEHCDEPVRFILPVIASPEEKVEFSSHEIRIRKNKGVVCITCESGDMEIAPADDDERIFNPVPGFSFIPLQVLPDNVDKKIHINICFR